MGISDAVTAASNLIDTAIDKIWPNPADKATAEAITIKASADAAVAQMAQSMSVMLAEANSADPWTSRARPSFMYVMYSLILGAIPIGVLSAFKPDMAAAIAVGMQAWLAAIPESMWTLFGACFLGYSASRTVEKVKGATK